MAPTITLQQVRTSTPHELLRISRSATRDEVRNKYHELCLQYHPDKTNGSTHEVFIEINFAYEFCMKFAARHKTDQIGVFVPKDRHESNRSPPAPAPPAWPLRNCPMTPPNNPPPFSPFLPAVDEAQVAQEHKQYMITLADLQILSTKINKHFLQNKIYEEHAEMYRAAEHVGRWLLAESRMHRSIYDFLQKSRWWTKRGTELARHQVSWYVFNMLRISPLASTNKLSSMLVWLETFVQTHIVDGHALCPPSQSRFIVSAMDRCPEDARDKADREERERKFEEKFTKGERHRGQRR